MIVTLCPSVVEKGTALSMPVWKWNGDDHNGRDLRIGFQNLYKVYLNSFSTLDFKLACESVSVCPTGATCSAAVRANSQRNFSFFSQYGQHLKGFLEVPQSDLAN